MNNSEEAKRKKSLGEIGELLALKALVYKGFSNITNLNDQKNNFPFGDLLFTNPEGETFIASVKSRNKYTNKGKLNPEYNIDNKNEMDRKINEALKLTNPNAIPAWIAVVMDQKTYSIYFGKISDLTTNGKQSRSIPVSKCINNQFGTCLEENQPHFFDYNYFGNNKITITKKLTKENALDMCRSIMSFINKEELQ